MRLQGTYHSRRSASFFRLALNHNSLSAYIMTNHFMKDQKNYSLTEIEAMIPWERDAYLKMLTEQIEAENKRIAAENAKQH